MPTNLTLQPERELLFKDLDEFYTQDDLDVFNSKYVKPGKATPKQIELYSREIHFRDDYPNAFIENEIRGFTRYLLEDRHLAVATLHGYFVAFIHLWVDFLNDGHTDICSVIEYEYEKLYGMWSQWLVSKGYKVEVTHNLVVAKEDMTRYKYDYVADRMVFFRVYYRFIFNSTYPDNTPEKEKDKWDIRKLGIPYNILPSRPRYTINYVNIKQEWLKDMVKTFNFTRIPTKAISTVLDDMKGFRHFSAWLKECNWKHDSLATMTRKDFTGFIEYLGEKGFVTSRFNRYLSTMKTFINYGQLFDYEKFPKTMLVKDSDYGKVVHAEPVPFSDNELRQLNNHIAEIPIFFGRMFFILENCGMRLSDIASSTIECDGELCVKQIRNDEWLFRYAQPKVDRDNIIPVSTIVAEVIKSAIEESREKYGADCKYIFASSATTCVMQESFTRCMNYMSMNNHLTSDDGTPLRIKGHDFRRTKACEWANKGISPDLIRMMLGQTKLTVLKHYIKIHSTTMTDMMATIRDEDEALIQGIFKTEDDSDQDELVINMPCAHLKDRMIPLANGFCGGDGHCDGNACYNGCRMFHPTLQCLPVYREQLRTAEFNIQVAEMNGWERELQINTELRDNLIRIINSLGGNNENGSER